MKRLMMVGVGLMAMAAKADVALVKDGKPCAEIVHDFRAPEPVKYAAQELQRWIGEITDAFVPIKTPDGDLNQKVRIYVGADFAQKKFPKDIGAFRWSDGFAARTEVADGVTGIYIFGQVPRGTLHGVYAFLERNSDIIWARPDPKIGTIFGKSRDFVAKDTDFTEIPKSVTRNWQWTWHSPKYETEWASRNRMNRAGQDDPKYGAMWSAGGYGHGIQKWIDRKVYFEKHPEWYPADKDGKRHAGTGQICFLAYEMIPEYVTNICKELSAKFADKRPSQVKIDYFNLSCDDNWDVCHCERCEKPFVCENGKVIDPTNEVFRSAQCYTFINKVARELRKTYPNVTVGTYAYEFTLLPPPFPLERNVIIEYCPYGLNEKAPVTDDDSNAFWHRCWDQWGTFSPNTWCRYYLGWANEFPRQIEDAIKSNGVYNLKLKYPVKHWSAEHPVDAESKVCPNAVSTWDSSAISAWLICRMWWDPTQDIEALRETYCRRAFREAWEPMKAFYDTIRKSVYSDKLPSLYTSSDPIPYALNYIAKPKLGDQLRGYLTDALAKAKHPCSKELIARQLKHFDAWMDKAKNGKFVSMDVPFRKDAGLETSFDADFWDKVGGTGDLVVADEGPDQGKPAKFRTTAKIVHDGENFYVRFDCWANDMKTLKGNVPTGDAVEQVPRGDVLEFYFGNASGVYYQFFTDVGNGGDMKNDVIYDAKVFDNTWNGSWTRKVKRYDDKWVAIVKMPFKDIEVNAVQTGKVTFQVLRGKNYLTGKFNKKGQPISTREMSSWGGGWVHQPQTFGEIKLELAK